MLGEVFDDRPVRVARRPATCVSIRSTRPSDRKEFSCCPRRSVLLRRRACPAGCAGKPPMSTSISSWSIRIAKRRMSCMSNRAYSASDEYTMVWPSLARTKSESSAKSLDRIARHASRPGREESPPSVRAWRGQGSADASSVMPRVLGHAQNRQRRMAHSQPMGTAYPCRLRRSAFRARKAWRVEVHVFGVPMWTTARRMLCLPRGEGPISRPTAQRLRSANSHPSSAFDTTWHRVAILQSARGIGVGSWR